MPKAEREALVPSFFLFGEPPRAVKDRFLHLEPLDVRSRPNDWTIRPHAHADLSQIFHLTHGGGTMTADGEALPFQAPCLLLAPARTVHGFTYEKDAAGSVLTIADAYLGELTLREPAFAAIFRSARPLPLGAVSISQELARLKRELAWEAPGHAAAVEAQLLAVLVAVLRRLLQEEQTDRLPVGPQAQLVAQFREAVEDTYRQPLSMGAYADRLGVTLSRLRSACLHVTARPPGVLLRERTLLEAKRALRYSDMTVAEAAYALGFDDPAYFSRFFTKAAGESPRAYRRRRGR
jgi:AraC family transcriptional activator of pobA